MESKKSKLERIGNAISTVCNTDLLDILVWVAVPVISLLPLLIFYKHCNNGTQIWNKLIDSKKYTYTSGKGIGDKNREVFEIRDCNEDILRILEDYTLNGRCWDKFNGHKIEDCNKTNYRHYEDLFEKINNKYLENSRK